MAARAHPQLVGNRQYWPEHWGISRSQLQELLAQLRQDAEWNDSNSMYTFVKDFIIPWTRGTGNGYALALNAASPLEVNLMVSHSWAENAEEFLEAVLHRQCWPQHWGISRSQIQELLAQLRRDAEWENSNSMYTLVKDFIIPWTRRTGHGYALALNAASPLEVNLMVSHSWAENAEDFLEALLRSTGPGDVLFVCALSLYQAADEYGPSIADQIGSSAPESPFRRVLEHIRRKGGDGGMLWRWRPVVSWVPSACLLLAACLYLLPLLLWTCVPGFRQCAHVIKFREDWVWGDYPHPWARLAPALAMLCATLAVLTFAALWWMQPYAGRMVVVPNREGDIYTRLWCTYEVFTAMRLGVHVKVANTLATAGVGRSEEARCSCEEDARRIRGEIADGGHTSPEIDKAV
eukprot:CAMPEP_0198610164 /NCGR_PEP_ID=MMETSP1462-20131121/156760_1 /TAXON_ID=1333877 /ORGANISM="Brandtodinium nutriculum, Strain RCC3387" /LENGTH=405 /DNA_ID=CAMNT_0044341971 /DNA_START=75 /DNA_END=1288 /DNA_ORIENTATION=+